MNKKFFAILTAAVLAAGSAVANTDSWYVSGNAGASFTNNMQNKDNKDSFRTKTGYGLGLAVGHSFDRIRAELEVGYNRNTIKDYKNGAAVTKLSSSYASLMTVMGNIYYDMPVTEQFDLYVGAGLGYGIWTIKINDDKAPASTFAYQGMTGITWKATQNVAISAGYRILTTADFKELGGKIRAPLIHRAELAARYSF